MMRRRQVLRGLVTAGGLSALAACLDLAAERPIGECRENGIRQYIRTRRHGNALVPPRELRALP